MDVHAVMESLRRKRGIFHLESDFQFAFAWEVKTLYPASDIRLEMPFDFDNRGRIDIIVRMDDAVYPIELKYLKKALKYKIKDEQFILAEGVHDMEMYSCVADIKRIEVFQNHLPGFRMGYAIWLTNDRAYWEKDYNASYYKAFHTPHGFTVSGTMYYDEINPKTGRPPQIRSERSYQLPITLDGSYRVEWNDYSDLGVPKGQFKYAVISVGQEYHATRRDWQDN